MRHHQQLISCYLALCLALAGAVGVSPVLHHLIEHGGKGPAHTHTRGPVNGASTAHSHDHSHHNFQTGQSHSHELERSSDSSRSKALSVQPHQPFTFSRIPFDELWQSFCQFFIKAAEESPGTADDQPGHEHQSLAQLLAAGLIDLSASLPPITGFSASLGFFLPSTQDPLLPGSWDVQTASRGPPGERSWFAFPRS